MDKGLIKGGSLENAVVVRGEAVLSKEPLRFREEFVRHKILDIVGDLALFGRASKATSSRSNRATARTPSWRARSCANVRRPWRRSAASLHAGRRRSRCQRCDEAAAASLSVPHGRPHRRLRRRDEITGVKSVTINEPFFQAISRAIRSCRACCSSKRWRRSAAS